MSGSLSILATTKRHHPSSVQTSRGVIRRDCPCAATAQPLCKTGLKLASDDMSCYKSRYLRDASQKISLRLQLLPSVGQTSNKRLPVVPHKPARSQLLQLLARYIYIFFLLPPVSPPAANLKKGHASELENLYRRARQKKGRRCDGTAFRPVRGNCLADLGGTILFQRTGSD